MILASSFHPGTLRSDKLDRTFPDLEGPFIRVIDAAATAAAHIIIIGTPRPQVVTTLYQVRNHHVVVLAEGIRPVAALAMAGRFIEIK